jgi:hypothetical protein
MPSNALTAPLNLQILQLSCEIDPIFGINYAAAAIGRIDNNESASKANLQGFADPTLSDRRCWRVFGWTAAAAPTRAGIAG